MIKPKTIKDIAEGILVFLKNNDLEEAIPQLIDYLKNSGEQSVVNVYSAKDLNSLEKKSAEKFVRNLIGENPKEIRFTSDVNLIDGLRVSYKDKFWDFSIQGQVSKLVKA